MCLKTSYKSLHFIMIYIYRPYHETPQFEIFFDIFLDLMQQVNEINLPIIICGYINYSFKAIVDDLQTEVECTDIL